MRYVFDTKTFNNFRNHKKKEERKRAAVITSNIVQGVHKVFKWFQKETKMKTRTNMTHD